MNSFAMTAKDYQRAPALNKLVQEAVKKVLLQEFPDVTVLMLGSSLSTDELTPVGQKVRMVLQMQITTKIADENKETP